MKQVKFGSTRYRAMHWVNRSYLSAMLSLALLQPLAAKAAISWFPLGPFGGDARSFAADAHDPSHLFLGTATGWIYDSQNGGGKWERLAQIAKRNDLVIKQILVDPRNAQHLMVGVYSVDHPDGGIYLSEDGGHTWNAQPEMFGHSVRSLTRAASDPNILVCGTLQGVYRSVDDGRHWTMISPQGSLEIHEVESVAIDPQNTAVIYAGTWHLPWKTVDGGKHWSNIKQGIIDDSDVFSIIVDPKQPQIVYASACSGIYKSTDAALLFRKVQGIPSSARRTRKLAQDPQHPQTVYAGTTEGLYRTLDGGAHWDRLTSPDVIVNDVYVDPGNPNHILLATDRSGVLASYDFAASFRPANSGFSARQVRAYAQDLRRPAIVYVGVVNDKDSGGVFESDNGGITWQQQSAGLAGRDIFSLAMTPDDVLLAGTNHGLFRLENGYWVDSGAMMQRTGRRAPRVAPHAAKPESLDSVVYALAQGPMEMYAATGDGLMRSDPYAHAWEPVHSLTMPDTRFVAVQGTSLLVSTLKQMAFSADGGVRWTPLALPGALSQVAAVAIDDQHTLWVGGREGVWFSTNNGASWQTLPNLTVNEVDSLYFDAPSHRLLLTCGNSDVVFSVNALDHHVIYWDSGWKLRFARPVGDYMLGATLYDGIVVQPKMVDTSVAPTKAAAAK